MWKDLPPHSKWLWGMAEQVHHRACVEGNSGSVWYEVALEMAVQSYKHSITQM